MIVHCLIFCGHKRRDDRWDPRVCCSPQKDSTIESTIGRLAQCHPQPSVSAQCTPRSDAFGILTSASSSSSSCIGPHRPSARCQWGAPHASCSLLLQAGINLAHRSAGINHTRRQWGYTTRAPGFSLSRRGLPRTPVSGDETTHAARGDYHSRLSLLMQAGITSHTGQRG